MRKRHIVVIWLAWLSVACSKDGSEQMGMTNQETEADISPVTSSPTDLFIVNIGFAKRGVKANATASKKAPYRSLEAYIDQTGNNDIIFFFGANFNKDGSFPLKNVDMPTGNSLFEVRNNQTISFYLTEPDDGNANLKITITEPFEFEFKRGRNLAGNVIHGIKSGKLYFSPLSIEGRENSLVHDKVVFSDVNHPDLDDLTSYGNLNIADNPEFNTGMNFSEFVGNFDKVGELYAVMVEVAVDSDNAANGIDGEDKRILLPDID